MQRQLLELSYWDPIINEETHYPTANRPLNDIATKRRVYIATTELMAHEMCYYMEATWQRTFREDLHALDTSWDEAKAMRQIESNGAGGTKLSYINYLFFFLKHVSVYLFNFACKILKRIKAFYNHCNKQSIRRSINGEIIFSLTLSRSNRL